MKSLIDFLVIIHSSPLASKIEKAIAERTGGLFGATRRKGHPRGATCYME